MISPWILLQYICLLKGNLRLLFFSLLNGAVALLDETPFSPEHFFRLLDDFHPTVFFCIPSGYRMILDYLEQHPDQLSKLDSIRIYISSGEPLSKQLASEWKKTTGKYISNNMGSSESSAVLFDEGHDESRTLV